MTKNPKNERMNCPKCDRPMIRGSLKKAGESVYVTSHRSLDPSLLRALVCPQCGHVELVAMEPENLSHEDISVEEIDDLFPSEEQ